jgi:hypothetical protein
LAWSGNSSLTVSITGPSTASAEESQERGDLKYKHWSFGDSPNPGGYFYTVSSIATTAGPSFAGEWNLWIHAHGQQVEALSGTSVGAAFYSYTYE